MKQRSCLHLPFLPEPGFAVQRHNRVTVPLLALALVVVLAAIACSEPSAKIAFISDRDGSEELYVMNADGSDVIRLTDTDGHIVCCPSWSPDGQRVVFMSDRDGDPDIYLVNADGSGLTQLTYGDRDDSNLAWSPDGRRIAFASSRPPDLVLPGALTMIADGSDLAKLPGGGSDLYLVNADGSDLTQLTDDAGSDFFPSWSPDGQRVVFMSGRDGGPDIYLVNADGSGLTQLTHSRELEFFPSWSPDGQRILFYTWPTSGNPEMYMMNADGSGLITQLTYSVEIDSLHSFPVMSPDWQRVERVVSFADPNGDDHYEIYIANADGSDLAQLTVADSYRGARDEKPIVFSATIYDEDGGGEIYMMNHDGSGLVRLTDNTSRDFAPHLAPAP